MLDFSSIVGHEDVVAHFKKSMERGKLAHAYMIQGEKDAGKKTLIHVIAKALQCESGNIDPCNTCTSCLQADTGNHPDIIWVSHEKPQLISVDEVKEQISDKVDLKPYSGRYKIYIIPDSEYLNVQAQNKLLKIIEEPPEHVILFFLTSNIDRMLPTIISRCVVLHMKPVREVEMLSYLKNQLNVPEDKAYFCMEFAFGNLGKAIRLATSPDYNELKDDIVTLMRDLYTMEMEDVLVAVKSLSKYKLDLLECLDIIMMWYRDILMLKVSNSPDRLVFKDEYTALRKQSNHISYEGIENVIRGLEKLKVRLEANVRFETAMELFLLTIKENYK